MAAPTAPLLQLQRSIGNAAVSRLLTSGVLQRKVGTRETSEGKEGKRVKGVFVPATLEEVWRAMPEGLRVTRRQLRMLLEEENDDDEEMSIAEFVEKLTRDRRGADERGGAAGVGAHGRGSRRRLTRGRRRAEGEESEPAASSEEGGESSSSIAGARRPVTRQRKRRLEDEETKEPVSSAESDRGALGSKKAKVEEEQRSTKDADVAAQRICALIKPVAPPDENYSVGAVGDNIYISKVGGLTANALKRLKISRAIRQAAGRRTIYLAGWFTKDKASNHAEMCILAAAGTGKVKTIYCTGPHCGFCGQMMRNDNIGRGSPVGEPHQAGWAHPFHKLFYGSAISNDVGSQLAELAKNPATNMGRSGFVSTAPQGRAIKW